jgi:hypothetical protein
MSWEPIIVLVTIAALLAIIFMQNHNLASTNKNLLKQNQNLLDRVQSGDAQTYSLMTALTNSSASTEKDEYIGQSDAEELARLQSMNGVGEPLYTDPEHEAMLSDLGIGLDLNDDDRR